jgi:hypothetical protein
MSPPFTEHNFSALRGSTLLGFLAALGAFRTLASMPDVGKIHMRWVPGGGSYCPAVRLTTNLDAKQMVEKLHAALHGQADNYVFTVQKDLTIPQDVFRALAAKSADDFLLNGVPRFAETVAAFGCDAVTDDKGIIQDTGFRTMSGAGHQHFLAFMNDLAKETTPDQVHEALFGPWLYRDSSPTMRWDAEDDRRYALRWDEPSKDPVRTVRGANLLAVAALPFFPVVPNSNQSVCTTGFSGRGRRDTFVTWPIWNGWLSGDTIRSLLSLAELQCSANLPAAKLTGMGITTVYRSQRITLGKFRNFTPSAAV